MVAYMPVPIKLKSVLSFVFFSALASTLQFVYIIAPKQLKTLSSQSPTKKKI